MQTILETKRIKKLRDAMTIPGACPELIKPQLEDAEDRAPVLLERDHMPAQVATEMLLNSAKMSGSMRRNCMRARERHFVSVQTKEAGIYKIARRFSRASLQQLGKWLRRANSLLVKTNKALWKLRNLEAPDARTIFLTKMLEARSEACQQTIDTIQTELKSRPIAYGI